MTRRKAAGLDYGEETPLMDTVYPEAIDLAELPDELAVPSFSNKRAVYHVKPHEESCTCPNHRFFRGTSRHRCKHLRLVLSGAPVEQLERGLLEDGTPVLILTSIDHTSRSRTSGFTRGTWQHSLLYDGSQFIRESFNLDTFESIVAVLFDWREWTLHIPIPPYRKGTNCR